jgi:uncharacterized LabA/DUF88 family protein
MKSEVNGVLIVDGANWSHALEGGRLRINYDRLVSRIQEVTGVKIVGLSYYTAYQTQIDLTRRWGFLTYLKNLGWQIQVMPATMNVDGRWRDKEVDVAIALDAYEEARSGAVGAVMIGSGDEDFAALFRRLPEGVNGWVISFKKSLSQALRRVAKVVHIEDLGVLYEARTPMDAGSPLITEG